VPIRSGYAAGGRCIDSNEAIVNKLPRDLDTLARRGWLAGQPEALRDWALQVGRWRSFEAGQVLYLAGDAADGLYGLGSGALDIVVPFGDDSASLHRADVGFWIGDSALLADKPRLVSVVASRSSRVYFLPAAALRLLRERPDLWPCFYELSHLNVALSLTLLGEALVLSPRARIARQMLRLAGSGASIDASQDELARLAGVTRPTLQRALADLGAANVLRTGYRRLELLDRAALQRMSLPE